MSQIAFSNAVNCEWQLLGLAYCNTLEDKKARRAAANIRNRGCLPGSSAAPRAAQHETRQTPSLRGCPAGQKKGSMAAQAADANEQNEQLRAEGQLLNSLLSAQ